MESKEKTELQKVNDSRRGGEFVSSPRPSQKQRTTDGQSEPCKLCGSNEWDTDISRGETVCSVCGFVVEQNMKKKSFLKEEIYLFIGQGRIQNRNRIE